MPLAPTTTISETTRAELTCWDVLLRKRIDAMKVCEDDEETQRLTDALEAYAEAPAGR
jgi:hypothetical protein